MANIDFDKLLKEIGLDPESMEIDAIDGAQQALGDIICSRGEEAELGLSLGNDMGSGGAPTKPDPRLNIPKSNRPADALDTADDMDDSDGSSSDDSDENDSSTDNSTSKKTSNSDDSDSDTDSSDSADSKSSTDDDSEEQDDVDSSSDTSDDFDDDFNEDDEETDNSVDKETKTDDTEDEFDDDDSGDIDDSGDDEDSESGDSESDSEGDSEEALDDEDSDNDESELEDKDELDDEEDNDEEPDNEEESEDSEDDFDEEDNFDEEDDLDELEDVDDPDSKDPAKEERRRRIGRLRNVLNQAEDAIRGPKTEALHENADDDLQEIERLRKLLDAAEDLTDEEFEAIEDEILKLANRHVKLTITSKEDKEKRMKRFRDEMSDQATLDELEAEDTEHRRKEHKQLSAEEKRRQQYSGRVSLAGFAEFKNSLYKAMARQVSRATQAERTWARPDKHNINPTIAKKGIRKNQLITSVPSIDFYFDQSGSWSDKDIQTGAKAVALLQEMERRKELKINIYYFSNDITTDPNDPMLRGGTNAWNKIVAKIKENNATNVVIMTDSDMDWYVDASIIPETSTAVVPGYVWFLWKNEERAPSLPKMLRGKSGTLEFTFNTGDV